MPLPQPTGPSYALTLPMVAAHAGALGIVCLDMRAEGTRYRLHASRPGPSGNRAVRRLDADPARADLPSGAAHNIIEIEPDDAPALIRVDISGPLEERAGYYGECGGWSDGHDAICERLCAAFALGDVLLVVDSPGGAAAGLAQNVARAAAAKVANGRRVTVYVNETCCSAAIWWASGVGDEIYGPAMAQIGSIGARGAHGSIAVQLAREGVAIEYFCWPNMGKVALAPELPLSEEGRARGVRDINILGLAFAAAVAASPMGVRFGLTVETIAALSADVFTGAYALTCPDPATGLARARLIDGVETLETVTEHALQFAESGEARAITDQAEAVQAAAQTGAASAQGERAMSLQTDAGAAALNARAEGDEPDDDDMAAPAAGPGTVPDGECKSCGSANNVSHKFCAQCGLSMAAPPVETPEDDGAPPSSKAPPMAASPAAPMAIALTAPKPVDASASLASILGAPSDSPLALKTAAVQMRQLRDTAAGVTGQTSIDAMIGSLLSMPDRIAAGDRAAAAAKAAEAKAKSDASAAAVKAERTERIDLCKRGIASGHPSMARGLVYTDRVSTEGKRLGVDLAPQFAEMKIATLRSLVTGLEASTPRRDPFKPDEEAAKAAAAAASPAPLALLDAKGEPTAAAIAVAVADPSVRKLFAHPDNQRPIEQIASAFIKAKAGGAQ